MILPYIDDLIGMPYRKGARGPDAWSCLGLVIEAYSRAGLKIVDPAEEGSEDFWGVLPLEHAQPGDLLVIDPSPTHQGAHVAVLWADGMILHCRPGDGVRLADLEKYRARIPFAYRLKSA